MSDEELERLKNRLEWLKMLAQLNKEMNRPFTTFGEIPMLMREIECLERQHQGAASGKSEEKEGGGGCYIATATLVAGRDQTLLVSLRCWRDEVMRSTQIGRFLEAAYDKIGPRVADVIRGKPILALTFLYPFVLPAAWLSERRRRNPRAIYDGVIYLIFLAGFAYGLVVYWLAGLFTAIRHR